MTAFSVDRRSNLIIAGTLRSVAFQLPVGVLRGPRRHGHPMLRVLTDRRKRRGMRRTTSDCWFLPVGLDTRCASDKKSGVCVKVVIVSVDG
mmetsp:Transcript_10362/g.32099  ORF Transcript_10362/g.32099 Transcript_10362/m.32099 type:complete len:91 (-) Transcript_10362:556-828(-)